MPESLPRVCLISTVHNEADLIGPFLSHYYGLGVSGAVIIDNESTDGTAELARRFPNVQVERMVSRGQMDDAARPAVLQAVREGLAGRFEWVIVADADEFLVPGEGIMRGGRLHHWRSFPEALHVYRPEVYPAGAVPDVVGSAGWQVVQGPGEGRYDPARPPLAQRRFGYKDEHYSKPCVLRPLGPSRLSLGQHWLTGDSPGMLGRGKVWPAYGPVPAGERLHPLACPFHLMHLQTFDRDLFTARRLKMFGRYGVANRTQGIAEADDPARLPPGVTPADAVELRWQDHARRAGPLPERVLSAVSDAVAAYRRPE